MGEYQYDRKPPRCYVVVRTDLSYAQQMVQVAHACRLAGDRFKMPPYAHVILLMAPDQETIRGISVGLSDQGINHYIFEEPDDNVGATAICTQALEGSRPKALRETKRWEMIS